MPASWDSAPLDVITAAAGSGPEAGSAARLDLCCGTGRALIRAARQLHQAGLAGRTVLTGADLADAFDPVPETAGNLELAWARAATWVPGCRFDLITCVHGLHYIGGKLALRTRATGCISLLYGPPG